LLSKKIRKLNTKFRSCDSCGGTSLDLVWNNKTIIPRRDHIWEISSHILICRNCGFCFCSPAPEKNELSKYYEDGKVGFKEISLPYSINDRLRVLEKYKVEDGLFLEIGGDSPIEFHEKCKKFFKKMYSIEVSRELKNNSIDIKKLYGLVDVVAHYDVLEHVLDIKSFLYDCFNCLNDDGVMVCEVPNLKLYPKNLLLQEAEHINHFTISSLPKIAAQVGFGLIDFDNKASRPYGFVAIFKKNIKNQVVKLDNKNEYNDAKDSIIGGINQVNRNNDLIRLLSKKIDRLVQDNQKVILWGVTDLMRSLLRFVEVIDNIIVLDSDPRRERDLILNEIIVKQPKYCKEEFLSASLLVICAPRYAKDILQWIKINVGKKFTGHSLDIIGVNSKGKTLR